MKTITLEAPAKVNLALDILRKRPDGYHDMDMVMQTVSLTDTVSVTETGEGFSLLAEGITLPPGKKSLEQQAAEAFFQKLGRPMPGLTVHLTKRIPAYAGMGGGSADVAAVLRGLRTLYAPELPLTVLEEIGFTVGSDMPFCVRGGTCRARGRGEVLTNLTPLPECWFVICKPDFDIPTPTLFARVRPDALENRPDLSGMQRALGMGDLAGVAERLSNVFESVLPPEDREVFSIKTRLIELGALNAAMSGSGPTVFGIFSQEKPARMAAENLRNTHRQVFLANPTSWEKLKKN